MQNILTTLTSSQLLNLKGTSVEVVPAQGSGFYILPIYVLLRTHAGSNVYGNLTSTLGLFINGVNLLPSYMSTSILGQSTDSFAFYPISSSPSILNVNNCNNQPVIIKNTGLLELTGGNGTLDVQVTFDLMNV